MSDETPTNQYDDTSAFLTKTLKLLALPLSAVTGLFFGHTFVRNKSYDNLKNLGAFDAERNARLKSAQEIYPKWGDTKDVTSEIKELSRNYSKRMDDRIADMGYETMGKRFKLLHRNQKFDAVMQFFTAAGVMLGVVLTIADHKNIFGDLFGTDKDDQTRSK
jgi:hypothetical protein